MKPQPHAKAGASPSQTVEAVLSDPTMNREQKIEHLLEMSRDAQALDVASGEGMSPGQPSGLHRIHRALRQLGAEDRIPPEGGT